MRRIDAELGQGFIFTQFDVTDDGTAGRTVALRPSRDLVVGSGGIVAKVRPVGVVVLHYRLSYK